MSAGAAEEPPDTEQETSKSTKGLAVFVDPEVLQRGPPCMQNACDLGVRARPYFLKDGKLRYYGDSPGNLPNDIQNDRIEGRPETKEDGRGIGVLIDMKRITAKEEMKRMKPYYIKLGNTRYYGTSPDDAVLTAAEFAPEKVKRPSRIASLFKRSPSTAGTAASASTTPSLGSRLLRGIRNPFGKNAIRKPITESLRGGRRRTRKASGSRPSLKASGKGRHRSSHRSTTLRR